MKQFFHNLKLSAIFSRSANSNRFLSLLLCFALVISMFPKMVLISVDAVQREPEDVKNEMTEAVQRQMIAIFDNWSNFTVAEDPRVADIDDVSILVEYEQIGAKGLVVKILDFYYDEVNGYYWYQIGPQSSSALPDALQGCTWVLYTTDFDLECNYQPYLALYSADQTIRFVDVQYTLDGETVESYIVVAGPAALKRTIITTAEVTTPYETSAMSYYYEDVNENGELVVEAWHRSFHIEVLKDTGPWQPEDGELSIRFMANQALNSSDSYYMGAFLYAGDKLQDFAAVDYWASASGVVYTGEGIVDLNLEMLCESFEPIGYPAYFGYSDVFLHDVYFSGDTKQMSLQEKGAYVDIEYFFLDENGFGWYFMTNSAINEQKYFLVECGLVDFLYEGEPLKYDNARLFLMRATTLEAFENVYECLTEELIAEFVERGTWEEIQRNYDHLVYCDFFGKESVSDFMALKEAYPSAWEYIQDNPEYKSCVDLHLANLQYAEAHPVEPDIVLGEGVLAESDTVFNPGGIVSPANTEPFGPVDAPSVASVRTGYVNHARLAFENRAVQQAAVLADMNQNRASGSTDSVELSKTVSPVAGKDGEYIITLEAYTTGETITIVTEQQIATDIVLILDMSSSLNTQFPVSEYRQVVRATAEDLFLSHKNDLLVKVGDSYQKVSITTGGTTKPAEGYIQALGDRPTARNLYDAIKTSGEIIYYRTGNNNSNYKYYALSAYARGDAAVDSTSGSGTVTYYFYYTDENGNVQSVNNGVGANTTLTGSNFRTGKPITYTQYTFTLNGVDMDGDGKNDTIVYADTDSVTDKYLVDAEGNPLEYYVQIEDNRATRLDAMVAAVEEFVYSVEQQSKGKDGVLGTDDDVPHRIAVVGFNNYSSDNTGIYIGDKVYEYGDNSYKAECGNAFQIMSTSAGVANVYDSIGQINTASSTHAHCALEMAYEILKANPGGIKEGETRNKTVVFFTDGDPNRQSGTNSTSKDDAAYNLPIEHAYNIKNDEDIKATIFAVAIWYVGNNTLNEATGKVPNGYSNTNQKVDRYLHYISSNFQQAKEYTDDIVATNTNYPDTNYYLLAKDASELSDIFVTIKNSVVSGGTTATLSTETQIRDIVSPYFELPPDASPSDIKVYTATYTGDGQFADRVPFIDAEIELSLDRKTINISGFDYQKNWVGTETVDGVSTPHGSKLIIEIPIRALEQFLGGHNVPTNGPDSGIYNNGQIVDKFEMPVADVPVAEIIYQHSEMHIYYGNNINLTQILNQMVRSVGNIPLDNIADGHSNAFLDMEFKVTATIDGEAHNYIFTLPAGQDWEKGQWTENGKIVDLDNVLLSVDSSFVIEMVMEQPGLDVLEWTWKLVDELDEGNYTQASWNAFEAALEDLKDDSTASDSERLAVNKAVVAAINALELKIPGKDKLSNDLQEMILQAEAALAISSGEKIPYQDSLEIRLAMAQAALAAYDANDSESVANAEKVLSMLREAVNSLIKISAIEGDCDVRVYVPQLTFADSLKDYLEYLYYYVDFSGVRTAIDAAVNALDTSINSIYQAIVSLVPKSTCDQTSVDDLWKVWLLVDSLNDSVFTTDSIQAAESALLGTGTNEINTVLETQTNSIHTAIGQLKIPGLEDMEHQEENALRVWIAIADSLNDDYYTDASFTALETQLDAAKALLAGEHNKNQMSDASGHLHDAINALVLHTSTGQAKLDEMHKALLLADAVLSVHFTEETYTRVKFAARNARDAAIERTQAVYSAINNLELNTTLDAGGVSASTMDSLTKIMMVLQLAKGLNKNNYTAESYALLDAAVGGVTSTLVGKDDAINNAINSLTLTNTHNLHANLQLAILRAKFLNPAHYTAGTYNAVKTALATAEKAMAKYIAAPDKNDSDLIQQVNSAVNGLNNAINKLELSQTITGQAELNSLIEALLAAEALRTMPQQGGEAKSYPDLQALLESHWIKTEWFHEGESSEGKPMEGEMPELKLEFAYDNSDNPFQYGLMNTQSDVPVSVTVQLNGHNADGTPAASITLDREDSDRITFLHECDRPAALCHFDPATEEFVIHVRRLALVIEVDAPDGCTDSFLFEVRGSDGTVIYATVLGNGYAVIMGGLKLDTTYTITQIQDWSWNETLTRVYNHSDSCITEYTIDGMTIQVKLTEHPTKTNHVVFENVDNGSNWLGDEDYKDNDFGDYHKP